MNRGGSRKEKPPLGQVGVDQEGATMLLQRLRKWLKSWWQGEYVPPDNPPGAPFFFVFGRYKRNWLSRLTHAAVDFYLREWKWLLMFVVAIVGALIAIKKL